MFVCPSTKSFFDLNDVEQEDPREPAHRGSSGKTVIKRK